MPIKPLLLTLSLVLSLFITSGCTSAAKLGGVTVSVTEISADASAKKLDAKLIYKNENVLSLAVGETTHTLYLNGVKVSKTTSKDPVGLPQLGQVGQTIAFTLDAGDSAKLLAALDNKAAYRIDSVLILEAGEDDEIKIKTSSSGTTPVVRAK